MLEIYALETLLERPTFYMFPSLALQVIANINATLALNATTCSIEPNQLKENEQKTYTLYFILDTLSCN